MTFAIMKDVPYLPCYADLLEEVQEFLRLQPTVSELLFCLFVFIFAYLSRFKC